MAQATTGIFGATTGEGADPQQSVLQTVEARPASGPSFWNSALSEESVVEFWLWKPAKVTLRKAYGYRTFRIAELSLYHVLGRLPEPKLAHRFF